MNLCYLCMFFREPDILKFILLVGQNIMSGTLDSLVQLLLAMMRFDIQCTRNKECAIFFFYWLCLGHFLD